MSRDANATLLITRVIAREGGIRDVGDGKGVTSYGQTPQWLHQWGFRAPTTVAEAAANYRTWLVRTRLLEVCDLPDAFADAVIDFAVHAGHPEAIRAMQQAIGVKTDGVIGPETAAAIEQAHRQRAALVVLAWRNRYNGRLVSDKPERYARYAAGWANRISAQLEALVTEL